MTKDPRQTLSSLVDGEYQPQELREAVPFVLEEAELRALWERYHLIGQAIRGETLRRGARGVSDALADRLAAAEGPAQPAVIHPFPGRAHRDRHRKTPQARLLPPVATALAAAMALLAVFVMPLGPADRNGQLADRGGPAPAVVVDAPAESRWHNTSPVLRAKLDHMLVSHHERAPAPRMPGYISYAAVVGHEASR